MKTNETTAQHTPSMNARMVRAVSPQEFAAIEHRCRRQLHAASDPFIRQLCELKLMLCLPRIVVKPDGSTEYSEVWNNEAAQAQAAQIEEIVSAIQADCFAPLALVAPAQP